MDDYASGYEFGGILECCMVIQSPKPIALVLLFSDNTSWLTSYMFGAATIDCTDEPKAMWNLRGVREHRCGMAATRLNEIDEMLIHVLNFSRHTSSVKRFFTSMNERQFVHYMIMK
ncbi:hypothetical protein KIN20_021618 [Parelaphostrongylus tenuis]|uniref:Uncharacterized protein n=1 Tax=Parelaphostrongylus tenuis TaxID=148309 RepID=A0AAD5N5G5_PARTN|nr:hypothetical protein KIN20_021618 [Parelaphostrongylus tenuis]